VGMSYLGIIRSGAVATCESSELDVLVMSLDGRPLCAYLKPGFERITVRELVWVCGCPDALGEVYFPSKQASKFQTI